jgi:hypothetical protein
MMKEKLLVQRLALEKDDAVGVDLCATLSYLSTLNIIMIETGRHAGLPLRMDGPMISTVDAAGRSNKFSAVVRVLYDPRFSFQHGFKNDIL